MSKELIRQIYDDFGIYIEVMGYTKPKEVTLAFLAYFRGARLELPSDDHPLIDRMLSNATKNGFGTWTTLTEKD